MLKNEVKQNMSKKLIPIKYIEELDKYIPKKDYIDLPPSQPLLGDDRYKKIYHTTSLNSFLLIWAKKRLKFAPLTGVNDMKEKLLSISGENPQLLPMLFAMDDVKRSYRQISFTMDFDTKNKGCTSPLMWGVYGDKNNGVCIELDYEKLKLPENCLCGIVDYKQINYRKIEIPQNVVTINLLKDFIIEHQKELFFVKDLCWEHENEYRILSDTDDYLDISEAISAVYVASIDSLTYEIVDELLKDSNVNFGFVHLNASNGVLISPDARLYKESLQKKGSGCLAGIYSQAKEFYEKNRKNWNVDLTKVKYNI